jgi:hypothetical protein
VYELHAVDRVGCRISAADSPSNMDSDDEETSGVEERDNEPETSTLSEHAINEKVLYMSKDYLSKLRKLAPLYTHAESKLRHASP